MAFSMALLEFISIHSLNVAPNSTAWSDTLETFWSRRGATSRHHVRALTVCSFDLPLTGDGRGVCGNGSQWR